MTEKKLTTNQELGETSYHKKEEKIVSIYERYCVQFYYYKNVFFKNMIVIQNTFLSE